MNAGKSAQLSATVLLLADLASQHERLGQMFTDLNRALSVAQATTGQAQRTLLKGLARAAPKRGVSYADAQPPQGPPMAESIGDRDMPVEPEDDGACQPEQEQRTYTSSEELRPSYEMIPQLVARGKGRMYSENRPLFPARATGDTDLSKDASVAEVSAELLDLRQGASGISRATGASRGSPRRNGSSKRSVPEGVESGEHPSAWELLEENHVPRSSLRTHSRVTEGSVPRSSLRFSNPVSESSPRSTAAELGRGRRRSVNHRLSGRRLSEHSASPAFHNASQQSGASAFDDQMEDLPVPRLTKTEDCDLQEQDWDEDMSMIRRNAIWRLQARLGKRNFRGNVTAEEVHRAVVALGLVKYTEDDIENWILKLRMACNEHEVLQRGNTFTKAVRRMRKSQTYGSESEDMDVIETLVRGKAIRFRVFVEALLDDETLSQLDAWDQQLSLTIREVLFSGDANRLVAELTHVRVDDVAAPMERADFMTYAEPLVGFMIFLNGVFIGLQTTQNERVPGDSWFWCNAVFTTFFVCEILLRVYKSGLVDFFTGMDRWWNTFDSVLIAIAVSDTVMELFEDNSEVTQLSVMRTLRLTRLARLIRIFRLRYMKELTLMVRGLLGGLHTLFWAVVLLFFTLYVIAILMTTTIGKSDDPVPELVADELFASLPKAIFTSFRCFSGDCTTSSGRPIIKLLSDRYGPLFILGYIVSMMIVTFGLFNVIIAIYIENTLNAAKMEGDKNRMQRQRESVRIARLTRQLLKKFCAVQRTWGESQDASMKEVKKIMNAAVFDDLGEIGMPVSKEMFLCIIQDPSVQKLMDDLDIPAERASLFDILDADGSGGLEISELITGLLRVRGEAKKSDVVGTLLAVRCTQDMLRDLGDQLASVRSMIEPLSRSSKFRRSLQRTSFKDEGEPEEIRPSFETITAFAEDAT